MAGPLIRGPASSSSSSSSTRQSLRSGNGVSSQRVVALAPGGGQGSSPPKPTTPSLGPQPRSPANSTASHISRAQAGSSSRLPSNSDERAEWGEVTGEGINQAVNLGILVGLGAAGASQVLGAGVSPWELYQQCVSTNPLETKVRLAPALHHVSFNWTTFAKVNPHTFGCCCHCSCPFPSSSPFPSPLPLQAVISGIVYLLGDLMAQSYEGREVGEWDRGRALRSSLCGLLAHGPLSHLYYLGMDEAFMQQSLVSCSAHCAMHLPLVPPKPPTHRHIRIITAATVHADDQGYFP
jgi:hypothetical protein